MKPIITTLCGILAGCLLTLASWERPETKATPATPAAPAITIPEATPVIAVITPPSEQPAPQPAPSVDAQDVVASVPVLMFPKQISGTSDCSNGTCSAPRAASVRRYQPVTRRGLFGGRFRR